MSSVEIPDRKDRLPIHESPIVVGRKRLTRIAEEEMAAGRAHFTEAFKPEDPKDLPDEDVQRYLDAQSGDLDLQDFLEARKRVSGPLTESQKQLWGFIGNQLQTDLDVRK